MELSGTYRIRADREQRPASSRDGEQVDGRVLIIVGTAIVALAGILCFMTGG
jgi:hypothetical protein